MCRGIEPSEERVDTLDIRALPITRCMAGVTPHLTAPHRCCQLDVSRYQMRFRLGDIHERESTVVVVSQSGRSTSDE